MLLLLFLLSTALSPRTEAGEIIGGHEARPHSRPYMAYLKIYDKNTHKTTQCGGFLIRKDVVLTAAHCHGSSINVTLGAHNIQKWERSWQEIWTRKAIVHPSFNYDKRFNDIMLLKLQRNARLTKEVGLLSLPDSQTPLRPGQVCSVAGWGQVNRKAHLSATLQEVEITVQEDAKCKGRGRYKKYDGASQLCIGDPKKKKGTIQGDSGGPLVCDNVAQGIISYGKRNGSPPQVCTRISSFMPWIKDTLRKM
ncbi:granzyme B-like [Sorex araneus]|uniref:granzyme B-like n=1 Tax=Sorex araneus TaxID=42254 RepID=UPI002433A595|nr:granzyme B-like [Sorex araneus]